MPSCCGSVCLLVVLGALFAPGSPVPFQFSERLKQTHESIASVLNLTQSDIVTNPLFSSVIWSINNSCQRKEVQLMNVTLDVYMRIFSSILQHNHNQHHDQPILDKVGAPERMKVESDLRDLQQMMAKLKSKLSRLNHDREDVIGKLKKIQVDDPVVQRKALAEFKEIYQAASVIGSH